MGTTPVRLKAANPVDKPTAVAPDAMAEIYHLGGSADATVLPHGHHKTAYDRTMEWDAVVDDKLTVKREVLEFIKRANKPVDGKFRYGHLVSYEEAETLMKTEQDSAAQVSEAPAPPAAPVVGRAVPLTVPAEVAQNPVFPVQSKVDVIFNGPFGRLKVRYDEVFVQDINLVLVQRGDADYEPPSTGEQPIGIETLGKRFVCFPGARIVWPTGSQTIDLFFIERTE